MSENYLRRQVGNDRRKLPTVPVFVREEEDENIVNHRFSVCLNNQRRLSTVSQLFFPHDEEYHSQEHVPPTGLESHQPFVLTTHPDERSIGGIAALYIRAGIQLKSIHYGAQHEQGLRPGTENVLAIVGLGKACQLISNKYVLTLR